MYVITNKNYLLKFTVSTSNHNWDSNNIDRIGKLKNINIIRIAVGALKTSARGRGGRYPPPYSTTISFISIAFFKVVYIPHLIK